MKPKPTLKRERVIQIIPASNAWAYYWIGKAENRKLGGRRRVVFWALTNRGRIHGVVEICGQLLPANRPGFECLYYDLTPVQEHEIEHHEDLKTRQAEALKRRPFES